MFRNSLTGMQGKSSKKHSPCQPALASYNKLLEILLKDSKELLFGSKRLPIMQEKARDYLENDDRLLRHFVT